MSAQTGSRRHWWLWPALLTMILTTGCWPADRLGRGGVVAEPVVADPPVVVTATVRPGPGPLPVVEPAPELVPYDGPVEHIFFHPLVAFPELAFDGDTMSKGYNDWFVTVPEFRTIVASLWQRGYILVDLPSLFENRTEGGKTTVVRRRLQLPKGKKPLVISVDDINYYDYMRQNGNVWKLVLDDEGRVATWSRTPTGAELISRDNEVVPILDNFVAEHPDFAWQGAKGVLAVTGYEGILGYRTNNPAAAGYEQEKQQALAVVQKLKETGWTFAAHGWGHQDAVKISYARLVQDTQRWQAEVEPLVGRTPVYIFPFGSAVRPGDPKFQFLLNSGFHVLCSVGPAPYLQVKDDYAVMDRRHIDGLALLTQRRLLLDLFDSSAVLDPVRNAKR